MEKNGMGLKTLEDVVNGISSLGVDKAKKKKIQIIKL